MINYRMPRTAGFLVALLPLLLLGCVERKLLIRSDPPGAAVSLNHEEPLAGTTPLEVEFTDYGVYHVRLTREKHVPLEVKADVSAPWWAWPPFDLITELLLPFTIEDRRDFDFELAPVPPPISYEEAKARHPKVIERAEDLRRQVNEGDPSEAE